MDEHNRDRDYAVVADVTEDGLENALRDDRRSPFWQAASARTGAPLEDMQAVLCVVVYRCEGSVRTAGLVEGHLSMELCRSVGLLGEKVEAAVQSALAGDTPEA